MDKHQNLVDVKIIKTEIHKADDKLSLCNIEMRNDDYGIKSEEIVAGDTDSGLTGYAIKIEFKSENIEEIVKCKSLNSVTTVKNEVKSEVVDTTYPCQDPEEEIIVGHTYSGLNRSLLIKTEFKFEDNFLAHEIKSEEININLKGPDLPEPVTVIQDPSANWIHRESSDNVKINVEGNNSTNNKMPKKQWQRLKVDQLSIGASNYKDDVMQRGTEVSFICYHCDYSTNSKRNLSSHMLVHDTRNKKLFACTNCIYSTNSKNRLTRHMAVHNKGKEVFSCEICSFKTHYNSYIKVHMKNMHEENTEMHSCRGCEKHFRFKKSLDDHIIKNHQNLIDLVSTEVHFCPICDYKTTCKNSLKKHTKRVHSEKYDKHLCTSCGKYFKLEISLDNHIIKTHQHLMHLVSYKIYSCPTCDYKTTMKAHLRCHMINVHSGNSEKHLCKYCSRHFKHQKSLDDHIVKNHPDFINSVRYKIHCCPICNYKTTNTDHLKHHTRKVHSGSYEKHSCKCCGKKFKDKRSLDYHIIKNHPNLINSVSSKVHSCSTCDYKTTQTALLKHHMIKLHSINYEKH